MPIKNLHLSILILFFIFLSSCSVIQTDNEEKIVEQTQTTVKKVIDFPTIEIKPSNSIATISENPEKTVIKPQTSIKSFVHYNSELKYDAENFFSNEELKNMHELELKYIRFQIYEKYNYPYKDKWYENYYKIKLGDSVPVEYSRFRMSRTDKRNEKILLSYEKEAAEKDKQELGWMPTYKEHIAKDLAPWTDTRYFLNIIDNNNEKITFSDGKEYFEIFPVNPVLLDQVDRTKWQNLVNANLDLQNYKDLSKSPYVYSALFTYRRLRYLVSIETVAGKIQPNNFKSYYIYWGRRDRYLRRFIKCFSDKEYDCEIYYDKQNNIDKIIQKVMIDRKIVKINFYKAKK